MSLIYEVNQNSGQTTLKVNQFDLKGRFHALTLLTRLRSEDRMQTESTKATENATTA